jgi:hypothetical protein
VRYITSVTPSGSTDTAGDPVNATVSFTTATDQIVVVLKERLADE